MCQVRLPITIPSCMCSTATLNLPTCECQIGLDLPATRNCELTVIPTDECAINPGSSIPENVSLDAQKTCTCSVSFAQLSATTISRNRVEEPVEPAPNAVERGKQMEAANGAGGPSTGV